MQQKPVRRAVNRPLLWVLAAFVSLNAVGCRGDVDESGATPISGREVVGTISLDPPAADIGREVTVEGGGWSPGTSVAVTLTIGGVDYTVAGARVATDGRFTTGFIVPEAESFKAQRIVPLRVKSGRGIARTYFRVTGPSPGETPLALVDAPTPTPTATLTNTPSPTSSPFYTSTPLPTLTPSPTPTRTPRSGQFIGLITQPTVNVRSGPGTGYAIVGQVAANDEVEIIGGNGAWWRIRFSAINDVGWIAKRFIDIEAEVAVPFSPAPPRPRSFSRPPVGPVLTPATSTPAPTATPPLIPLPASNQCLPLEWTGCGGRPPAVVCGEQHVAQCQADGTWGECVWDPGGCGGDNDNDDRNDDDDDDDGFFNGDDDDN